MIERARMRTAAPAAPAAPAVNVCMKSDEYATAADALMAGVVGEGDRRCFMAGGGARGGGGGWRVRAARRLSTSKGVFGWKGWTVTG